RPRARATRLLRRQARPRSNRSSVPIPKFASLCRSLVCELRNRRTLEPISKSFEEDNEAGKLDKAEEVVGVVLPANEDPALPLNLTFCAIFARLYPSPIYSHREHTLVCWSKPCPASWGSMRNYSTAWRIVLISVWCRHANV